METLGQLILFVVLFYLMMRVGCGSHMRHGSGHDEGGTDERRGSKRTGHRFVDPVCGTEVAPSEGYGKMYEGIPYRFCSRACLDEFDVDEKRYAGRKVRRAS